MCICLWVEAQMNPCAMMCTFVFLTWRTNVSSHFSQWAEIDYPDCPTLIVKSGIHTFTSCLRGHKSKHNPCLTCKVKLSQKYIVCLSSFECRLGFIRDEWLQHNSLHDSHRVDRLWGHCGVGGDISFSEILPHISHLITHLWFVCQS